MKATKIIQWMATLMLALFVGSVAGTVLGVNPLSAFAGILLFAIATSAGMYLMNGQSTKGLMMAVTLYAPCTEDTPAQTAPGDCIDEGSGIVGLLLIKKGFNIATVIVDDTAYGAAKTAEDIIVVKDLEAYWPNVTQNTIPGFRGRIDRHGNINYELPFKHEGVDANLAFWNHFNNNRDYGVALITEEYKAFACLERVSGEPVLASIFAAPASEQEFGKTRFMQGTVKWKHKDLPYHLDLLTRTILEADFQS
jgi:hypothetical protein